MKTKQDHLKAILKYHKDYLKNFDTIFKLKVHMIELHLCPNCGKHLFSWSSSTGYFPCGECGFNLSEKEINKVTWNYDNRVSEKMKKHLKILKRKLNKVKGK